MITLTSLRNSNLRLATFIFFLALTLRLFQINAEGINPDEYHWHDRTNRFYHAVLDQKWDQTMTAGHPGATVTWQSMISLRTMRRVYRVFDPAFDYQDYPYLTQTFDRVHLAYVLPITLTTSLFIAFFYWSLTQLTNIRFSLLATALVLTDVFFLAHSRVVQMDALQTSYVVSSLLTALLYRKDRRLIWLLVTGILVGFSAMTKIYGLAILPLLWIIMSWNDLKSIKTLIRNTSLLIITIIITSVILLPQWIADFDATINAFQRSIFQEGLEGLWEGTEIFWGQFYKNGEPKFFYLISLWFRQSIIPFLGIPLTLFFLLKGKIKDRNIRQLNLLFLFTSIYWLVFLSIPTKMEDRYILVAHIMLDLVAAAGIYVVYDALKTSPKLPRIIKQRLALFCLTGLIILTLVSLKGLRYEYLGYYNPLMGGNKNAVKFIRVGWGEGLKQSAAYLNNLKDAKEVHASGWYESAISPYCECVVRPTFLFEDEDVEYLVYYINQLQRQREDVMIDKYFKDDDVVFVEKINGLPYSWIVKKP